MGFRKRTERCGAFVTLRVQRHGDVSIYILVDSVYILNEIEKESRNHVFFLLLLVFFFRSGNLWWRRRDELASMKVCRSCGLCWRIQTWVGYTRWYLVNDYSLVELMGLFFFIFIFFRDSTAPFQDGECGGFGDDSEEGGGCSEEPLSRSGLQDDTRFRLFKSPRLVPETSR